MNALEFNIDQIDKINFKELSPDEREQLIAYLEDFVDSQKRLQEYLFNELSLFPDDAKPDSLPGVTYGRSTIQKAEELIDHLSM